jgi:hypothetical protein
MTWRKATGSKRGADGHVGSTSQLTEHSPNSPHLPTSHAVGGIRTNPPMSFPSDLQIAQQARMQHINAIGEKLGIPADDLELYGKYKAKLPLDLIDEDQVKKSKLILVTAHLAHAGRARARPPPASASAKA